MTGKATFTPEQHAAARRAFLKRYPRPARSLWTLEHERAAAGSHYDRREELPIGYMPPKPLHAQTPAALAAVEAVRQYGLHRRDVIEADLVATHVPPWRELQLEGAPSAVRLFAGKARAAGCEVSVRAAGDRAYEVGVGRDGVLLMRAAWSRTPGGTLTARGVAHRGRKLGMTAAIEALSA